VHRAVPLRTIFRAPPNTFDNFDACAGYYLTIINDLCWNFSFYGSWTVNLPQHHPRATTAPAQVLAGPPAIDEDIRAGVVGWYLGPSFLVLLQLPSDFGSELAKHIDETANPDLGDGTLISLDKIVRISRLPRGSDHSSAE
jgi:hypothetical protein